MTNSQIIEMRGVDEAGSMRLAETIAQRIARAPADSSIGGVIYLVGELGAGKTTFARALLRRLGITARVKSPTYTLIESYATDVFAVHHLDLYRIADPGELEWLGLADLTGEPHLLIVEWPERARGTALPPADLKIDLAHADDARNVRLQASSDKGRDWLRELPPAAENSERP